MNAQTKHPLPSLSKKVLTLLIVAFFLAPSILKAGSSSLKDSILIVLKSGRDKRYYKGCGGADVRILSSFDRNQTEILTLVQGTNQPLIKGLNDNPCSESTSLLQMAINNMLTGKVKLERKNSPLK